ncbi:MAG TPA: hypothetical protein VHL09_16500 [Dehalococcoidia bacterium]|nr:hypothetical protein [Dehalococcoidia bacterium]
MARDGGCWEGGRKSQGHHRDSPRYSTLQVYLLERLVELERRRSTLPLEFRDHPIGRLTESAIEATSNECRWVGVAGEADRILRSAPAARPA